MKFLRGNLFYVVAAVLVVILGILAYCFCMVRKRRSHVEIGEESPPGNDDAVRRQFVEHAAVFSGLYEAVYRIGKGESRFRQGVAGDFAVRLGGIDGAEELKAQLDFISSHAEWDSAAGAAKMNELIGFFFGNGVVRDSAGEITVDSETYSKYDVADGERLYEGTVAAIKTPCWHISGKLLEKGIIIRKEEESDE